MSLPPNHSPTNRVYVVVHKRNPANTWYILAKSGEEAIRVTLDQDHRLKSTDLIAKEQN